MRNIITQLELQDGRPVVLSVNKKAILVSVEDKACLAHNRWFDKETAKEMVEALQAFIG